MKKSVIISHLIPTAVAFHIPRAQDVIALLHREIAELVSVSESSGATVHAGVASDLTNYCASTGNAVGDLACEVQQQAMSLEAEILAVLNYFNTAFGDSEIGEQMDEMEEEVRGGMAEDDEDASVKAAKDAASRKVAKAVAEAGVDTNDLPGDQTADGAVSEASGETGGSESSTKQGFQPTVQSEQEMKSAIDKMDQKRKQLDANLKGADPELKKQLERVVDSTKQLEVTLTSVATGAAPPAEAFDSIKQNVDAFGEGVDGLHNDVVPSENKWWRYRYEYSLTESMILTIMLLGLIFLDTLHDFVVRRITELEIHRTDEAAESVNPSIVRYHKSAVVYNSLLNKHLGSIAIVGWLVCVVFILSRMGAYEWLKKNVHTFWIEV